VVKEEADFRAIAAQDFLVDPQPHQSLSPATRNVAFTWKTTNSEQGAYRNIPIDELIGVMRRHDLRFHNAQHGVSDAERERFRAALGDRVFFDTIEPTGDVERFATQLKAMDALFTIDNSALHIGGAFGVPTYGLLSVPSYWAWPRSSGDSRWYSSVRLIHQQKPGHWADVLGELSIALERISDAAARPQNSSST
jgi:ADP-heptose:LPS heptosyltransferase